MLKKFRTYLFATFCLFLIVALIFFSFYLRENAGIQSIRLYNKGDEVYLKIKYVDCMGYSVESLKNNETIMIGEREVNYSNLIGENATQITLYETKISDKLKKDYEYFEVYDVNLKVSETKGDIDIKFILCPSPEHSLKIYLGFDNDFQTFINEYTKINSPLGTIRLELGKHK
jgi:hypothetical protein